MLQLDHILLIINQHLRLLYLLLVLKLLHQFRIQSEPNVPILAGQAQIFHRVQGTIPSDLPDDTEEVLPRNLEVPGLEEVQNGIPEDNPEVIFLKGGGTDLGEVLVVTV